jgi:hypothetical protein
LRIGAQFIFDVYFNSPDSSSVTTTALQDLLDPAKFSDFGAMIWSKSSLIGMLQDLKLNR